MPCFNPMIAFIKDEALDNPEWFSNKPFRFSKADKKNADLYDKLLRSGNIPYGSRYIDDKESNYHDK